MLLPVTPADAQPPCMLFPTACWVGKATHDPVLGAPSPPIWAPQVQFSADGNFLYTGARRDPALHCWDVRYTSGVVYTLHRASATTNQRIQFDIEPCGRHLASGEGPLVKRRENDQK